LESIAKGGCEAELKTAKNNQDTKWPHGINPEEEEAIMFQW
jgi:hypothetical protein